MQSLHLPQEAPNVSYLAHFPELTECFLEYSGDLAMLPANSQSKRKFSLLLGMKRAQLFKR